MRVNGARKISPAAVRWLLVTVLAAALVEYPYSVAAPQDVVVIKGGKIQTVIGTEIDGGSILIENGKIKDVGKNIAVPEGAQVISAENCWVMPGMIDAHSTLGLREEGRTASIDELSTPNAAALMIVDSINPFDKGLKEAARAGITATFLTSGRANVIGGQGAVVKTVGKTVGEMTLLSPAGMKFSLGEGPKDAFGEKGRLPSTRMGSAYVVRNALIEAREYLGKWKAYEAKQAKAGDEKGGEAQPPNRDLALEALGALLDGRNTAFFECYRADDVMTALRLIDEFKMKAVLIGCAEGYKIAEEIAARKVPVIVGPMGIGSRRVETEDLTISNAAVLSKAGVRVVIQSEGAFGLGAEEELPLVAALAVKGGMSRQEALRSITLTAAEVLGVAGRIGSLEPGKDADIVIFDGDPLFYKTRVVRVLINGDQVHPRQ